MSLRPKALIIGAQKAATSALIHNLSKHENIWGPKGEIHYFSKYWDRGEKWYLNRLNSMKPDGMEISDNHFVIEKSPSYLSDELAAERIHDFDSEMKILICLRDPVDRAFSRYNDILIDTPEKISSDFEESVNIDRLGKTHFLSNGLYAQQIERYLKYFDTDQIHVIVQERWLLEPKKTLAQTFEFLGQKPFEDSEVSSIHSNNYANEMKVETRQKLQNYFKPHNEVLFTMLGFEIPEWS